VFYEALLTICKRRRAARPPQAPLAWHAGVATVAFNHSADMAAAGIGYSTAGENIAAGQSTRAAVMTAWMASTGHRNNILSGSFTKLGVGVKQGGSYGIYWTQLFRAP